MPIDLRQYRHVLALDQHRNFARAAEALGLTQPALSRSLQALEKSIGARLFDRDRTRVEPTPVGERLIERARLLVNQARDVEQDLGQMLGLEAGLLRIGAGPYPADLSVGTAVGRLLRLHPALMVDLAVGDWTELTRRVASGELDMAIADTSLAQQDDRLVGEALPQHQLKFFCRPGHPLAGAVGLTLEQLRRFPLVSTSLPGRFVALAANDNRGLRATLPAGVTAPAIRVGTFALTLKVVMESDAIGGAVPSQIEDSVTRGELVTLPLDLPWLKTGYGIIRLANRTPSPAAMAFLEILREVEAGIG
ncbi:MAG: LysR family transcriptional regulator [Steroidobacteraceae bacterium]|nr:LysR family transcriptional regulator [Steroidobacteraceae bacterium]